MQAKSGKTLRVSDSYKVVDSSNSCAFVWSVLTEVFDKDLAKPIYTRVQEAIKHVVTTKQLSLPISFVNTSLISNFSTYDHKQAKCVRRQSDGCYV